MNGQTDGQKDQPRFTEPFWPQLEIQNDFSDSEIIGPLASGLLYLNTTKFIKSSNA